MNTQELIKKLKKNQCYILRHGSRMMYGTVK